MKKQTFTEKCFKDGDGNVVIGQKPNLPIILWIISLSLSQVTKGNLQQLLDSIAFGALFTWAYLELFQGANYFRRFLGLGVLLITLYSRIY